MTAPALKRFGDQLRNLRRKQGISQEQLAELAGLHRTYVGSVERGERNISLLNLLALAKALDISLSALFKHVDSKVEPPPNANRISHS